MPETLTPPFKERLRAIENAYSNAEHVLVGGLKSHVTRGPNRARPRHRQHASLMGGALCFRCTRVPQAVVDENLADGMSVDDLFDSYPTLDRSDVLA